MRRAFDYICALIGFILTLPLFLIVALAVKIEDGGPIFYVHPRVGKGFSRFGLLKFRTMVINADRIGGAITAAGDPRVTRVGRILREYKLDELPQLLNVLTGDLQLVGPRPEFGKNVARFRPQYELLLRQRPGITDPATLAYRHEEHMLRSSDVEEEYFTFILPHKLELSLEYARRRTFVSDLGILLRTVLTSAHYVTRLAERLPGDSQIERRRDTET